MKSRSLHHFERDATSWHVLHHLSVQARLLAWDTGLVNVGLLEEVRDAGVGALPVDVPHPIDVHHRPCPLRRPLTARDDPVDPAEVGPEVQAGQQRLGGDESHTRREVPQQGQAVVGLRVAARHPKPDVGVAVAPVRGQAVLRESGPLREDQPVQMLALPDDLPGLGPPRVRPWWKKSDIEQVKTRCRSPA
jgi:hypothetical protein